MVIIQANQESLSNLLGNAPYLYIRGQLLFKQDGKVMLTEIQKESHYTVKEYAMLPKDAPFELINGKLAHMPSPFIKHQRISGKLYVQLYTHIQAENLGEVFSVPLDVHFDKENVFQPDLLFVSNKRKHIIQEYVYGAPNLVVEISSKGTAEKDQKEKKAIYEQYGVQEYWIIEPKTEHLELYTLEDGILKLQKTLSKLDTLESNVLKGFKLKLNVIFD